ncbi:hypothetical protein L6452_32696 [Arctium lappa]|uniref:Uncharacterized protein n=1 Tax=Arctium lappa TaxID=4217 RepID=A0ACB8Z593_ARCLA|nr:hypothetical protein L6452_32696 [Arctium lappa]
MPVPEALLAYANPNSMSVRAYRESMGLPEPVIPTQDLILRREESVRILATEVVQERGVKRKNLERGTGGGRRPRLEASGSQAVRADNSEEIPSTTSENDESEHDETINAGDANDDDNDNDGGDSNQHDQDQGGASIQADDTEQVNVFEQFYEPEDMEIDVDSIIRNVVGDIRSNEGVLVENINDRMSVNVEKEYG